MEVLAVNNHMLHPGVIGVILNGIQPIQITTYITPETVTVYHNASDGTVQITYVKGGSGIIKITWGISNYYLVPSQSITITGLSGYPSGITYPFTITDIGVTPNKSFQSSATVPYGGAPSSGGGSFGGGGCLIAGTKIRMANDTLKNVEDVIVGDVLFGHATHLTKHVTVMELRPNRWDEYYIINNRLKITYEHPVMIYEKGLTEVKDLIVGDKMIRYDSTLEPITSIEIIKGETPTYNFVVDQNHLYIADDIIVHNPHAVQKY